MPSFKKSMDMIRYVFVKDCSAALSKIEWREWVEVRDQRTLSLHEIEKVAKTSLNCLSVHKNVPQVLIGQWVKDGKLIIKKIVMCPTCL